MKYKSNIFTFTIKESPVHASIVLRTIVYYSMSVWLMIGYTFFSGGPRAHMHRSTSHHREWYPPLFLPWWRRSRRRSRRTCSSRCRYPKVQREQCRGLRSRSLCWWRARAAAELLRKTLTFDHCSVPWAPGTLTISSSRGPGFWVLVWRVYPVSDGSTKQLWI